MEDILNLIRRYYDHIYQWHLLHGEEAIEKLLESNKFWHVEDSNVQKYRAILYGMLPTPEASLEQMTMIAREAVMGILEINYGARVTPDMNLGEIGKKILNLTKEISVREEEKRKGEGVYGRIRFSDKTASHYFLKAIEFYSTIPLDNDRNLGGRVALADTNWEFQRLELDAEWLFFRKPERLHFSEIQESANLYQLAAINEIQIISINIK